MRKDSSVSINEDEIISMRPILAQAFWLLIVLVLTWGCAVPSDYRACANVHPFTPKVEWCDPNR
jgi:hypothetical protein